MPRLNDQQRSDAIAFNNRQALDVLGDLRVAQRLSGDASAYDAALVEAVAAMQAENSLEPDGKVGQRTRELLSQLQQSVAAAALWPAPDATEALKFQHYQQLCRKLGYPRAGVTPLLIGFRGVRLRGPSTHPSVSRPEYDDTFVLLALTSGAARVREFAGATHPYQLTSAAAPDADGDGSPDVGTIRPGQYLLVRLASGAEHPKLWLKCDRGDRQPPDPRIPTWRDTDHTGTITATEAGASEARTRGPQAMPMGGDYSTEVLLHPGFTAQQANGKRYSSIGCQTAALGDVQAVAEHEQCYHLLLDARQALAALAAQSDQEPS